jgi:hypothetical protein
MPSQVGTTVCHYAIWNIRRKFCTTFYRPICDINLTKCCPVTSASSVYRTSDQ